MNLISNKVSCFTSFWELLNSQLRTICEKRILEYPDAHTHWLVPQLRGAANSKGASPPAPPPPPPCVDPGPATFLFDHDSFTIRQRLFNGIKRHYNGYA
ncbi:hypothetical protein C8035_v004707 [Colletotrichum spinosum]|uniref:Uncharacterized protein n=1 Tax=Colletotrichum spinosum TaxID=1347390 RepID=A0A4V3HT67_9PEZI|nr:hypothetical protein C8035_v004707 [Colletotrichum spinosum]